MAISGVIISTIQPGAVQDAAREADAAGPTDRPGRNDDVIQAHEVPRDVYEAMRKATKSGTSGVSASTTAANTAPASPQQLAALPPSSLRLFTGTGVVKVAVEAPLQALFKKVGLVGMSDDLLKIAKDRPAVSGTVVVQADDGHSVRVPALIYIDGNTSQTQMAFPKLKFDFKNAALDADGAPIKGNANPALLAGTELAGIERIRLNTHGGDDALPVPGPGQDKIQDRVNNENTAWRESLAYDMVRALSVPAFDTRVAEVSYTDTGAPQAAPIVRRAMFRETGGQVADRFGAKEVKIDQTSDFPHWKIDQLARTVLRLSEVLIHNWDAEIPSNAEMKTPGTPIWNLGILQPKNATDEKVFFARDFDRSSLVTGFYDPAKLPAQMYKSMVDIKRSERKSFAAALAWVTSQRPNIEKAIADSLATKQAQDPDAVRFANQHLQAFYLAVEKLQAADAVK